MIDLLHMGQSGLTRFLNIKILPSVLSSSSAPPPLPSGLRGYPGPSPVAPGHSTAQHLKGNGVIGRWALGPM